MSHDESLHHVHVTIIRAPGCFTANRAKKKDIQWDPDVTSSDITVIQYKSQDFQVPMKPFQ